MSEHVEHCPVMTYGCRCEQWRSAEKALAAAEAQHKERCPFIAATERMLAQRDAALARAAEINGRLAKTASKYVAEKARVAALEAVLRECLNEPCRCGCGIGEHEPVAAAVANARRVLEETK